MQLDFECFIIKSALNYGSQETKNQVFLLKSMGPGNQNFVTLSLVITNKKVLENSKNNVLQLVLMSMGQTT